MWTAPQPVYIDTRLEVAGEKLFREHMGSFSSGGLQILARKTRADLIVFDPRRTPAWTEQLRAMPWRLVLWRPNVVIYARQGYAENIPGVNLMDQVRQEIIVPSEEQVRAAILAPTPSPAATWWSGFFRRQVYPEAVFSMAYFADQNEDLPAASSLYTEAIHRGQGRYPDFYLNLGFLFSRFELDDLAQTCFQVSRRLGRDPGL
jgi:hypothetical protein